MASSLALKKLVSSNLLPKSLLAATRQAIPAARSASWLFNTNAVREFHVDNNDDRSLDTAGLKSNLPTYHTCSVSFRRCGSYQRETETETEDCLSLRIAIPGIRKEQVEIVVKQNTLFIDGENLEESAKEDGGQRYYSNRIDLADKVYRTDQIKAKMKNGVLKVVVPKVKDEEPDPVFQNPPVTLLEGGLGDWITYKFLKYKTKFTIQPKDDVIHIAIE